MATKEGDLGRAMARVATTREKTVEAMDSLSNALVAANEAFLVVLQEDEKFMAAVANLDDIMPD